MATVALALVAPPAGGASAATLGTTSGATTLACAGNNLDCTVIGRRHAPSGGVLTQFRLKHGVAQPGGTVKFKTASSDSRNVTRSTESFPLPTAAETSVFTPLDGNGKPKGLAISANELLGVYVQNPAGTSNANLVKFKSDVAGEGWEDAAGDVGVEAIPIAVFSATGDPLVEASLEPDADGDGYGDESQDNCPSQVNNQTTDPCRPTVTFLTTPPARTNSGSASFGWRSSEYGTSFSCSVEGGSFTPCNDNNGPVNAGGITLSGLGEGTHTLAVRGSDSFGAGVAATFEWTVDMTPPVPSIVGGPGEGGFELVNDSSPSFGLESNEPNTTFECRLRRGATIVEPFATCTDPESYTGLVDGTYTFTVKATDAAGNASGELSREWQIDTAPPPAPQITAGPGEQSRTSQTAATFGFATSEAATFECMLDEVFVACTSHTATSGTYSVSGLSDGSHEFVVFAIDAAGNYSYEWRVWTVDTIAPDTSGTVAPPNPSSSASAHFEYTSTEAYSTYECQLERGGVVIEAYAFCDEAGKSYANLTEGTYKFWVRATDDVGNTDPTPA